MADSDSSRYGWRDFLTDYGLLVTLIGIVSVPRIGYSLSLGIEGQQATYETAKTIEVFGKYYLCVFESEPAFDLFKELSRDVILLPPRGTLRRGKPVFGWLGFEIRGLPAWPEHREPIGVLEERIYDSEGKHNWHGGNRRL